MANEKQTNNQAVGNKRDDKKELVVCIVNNGYSDLVMQSAKNAGARGGTIFHARGTGNSDGEEFFGIKVSPDKEVIFIVCYADLKDEIIKAIYKDAGLNTKGQGIVFTLPVEDFVSANAQPLER